MKRILRSMAGLALLVTLIAGCDDDAVQPDPGPFTLTFQGDASFQGTAMVARLQTDDAPFFFVRFRTPSRTGSSGCGSGTWRR